MERERRFLIEKGHAISFDEDVLIFLFRAGFDKYLGARPLSKTIEKHIRFPLADYLVRDAKESLTGTLHVNPAEDALIFESLDGFK